MKTKTIKKPVSSRQNAPRRLYNPQKSGQKDVRKSDVRRPVKSIVQNNLGHLVAKTKIHGDVKKYVAISKILSKIANLPDGKIWSWRYITSVHNGTMQPSKKFVQALNAYMKNSETQKKRRCYFAGCHGVLMAMDTSIMVDVIAGCVRSMGYKPVNYSRYMQVKKMTQEKR